MKFVPSKFLKKPLTLLVYQYQPCPQKNTAFLAKIFNLLQRFIIEQENYHFRMIHFF